MENQNQIVVRSQADVQEIPTGYPGTVLVESGEPVDITLPPNLRVSVTGRARVFVFGKSSVEVYGHARVVAYGESEVRAHDESQVISNGRSKVYAYGNSTVKAHGRSHVHACHDTKVIAFGASRAELFENARGEARDMAEIWAWHHTEVWAFDTSRVYASQNARVKAYETALVELTERAHAELYGFAQAAVWDRSTVCARGSSLIKAFDASEVRAHGQSRVLRMSPEAKVHASGCATIMEPPETAEEYCDYFGVEARDGSAILYKAVRDDLSSFWDPDTRYTVGETMVSECDPSRERECSTGLHAAPKELALRFGMQRCENFRLLEVAVPLGKMVVPRRTEGKVRTSEMTVLREVPRDEWGIHAQLREKLAG